ncbi:hypothetical protein CK203_053869 [Vitis vinifera]|uniref:Uncharacterized protein n=1 Tax=Vitis vinifera TaxID=29760 RepID=A0A438GRI7_VITVI|nr:hypothetical protein CK203_053869 [Vitis vinifera]
MVNDHRRRNNVDIIRINGVWILEENEIKERIVNVFMSLLSNSGDWCPPLSGLQCETLENMDAYALEVSFMEEKVFGVLLGCSEDKALGPDGFSMAFWQFAWDFVKDNWLTKVLANSLKKVVGNVVSKAQGAFVKGRQILDAMLIANEVIDSILKNNENGILCKLDIEKAYDNVDWSFLLTLKGIEAGQSTFALFICDCHGVFYQASQDHLTHPSWLLKWFKVMSGLRINLEKSELIPVGRVENIDNLALNFSYKVGSLPSTYLGFSLEALFKLVTMWDEVEKRFRRRLVMWKRQYLSK